jgi:DNA helicase-2/ATP-dependent DNA helicase PcrA
MASRQIGKVLCILRANGFKLNTNDGKARAVKALDLLAELQPHSNFGGILTHVSKAGLLVLPDDLRKSIALQQKAGATTIVTDDKDKDAESAFYQELLDTPYSQIFAFCQFLEEHTPFSTKHGVKGNEFDTVFVILDDRGAKWNQYSFDKYLSGEDEAKGLIERWLHTRNLFYVCCSRAKKNLAVVDFGGQVKSKDERLKELFGTENCYVLK